MKFKQFFLEKIEGKLSNAHHQKNLISLPDGGVHKDGKIKSLKTVAAYRTKELFKDKKQENLKNGNVKIERIYNPMHLNKIVADNGLNLANMTPAGLCLNGKTGIVLKRDHKGYYMEIKK